MADGFWLRFKGLMGRSGLDQGEGLLLSPCNMVHMFFMQFPLDLIFLNQDMEILETVESLKPWRLSRLVKKSCQVLECPVGTISRNGISRGEKLELREMR
ncbi:MAG: DUF192 domain-containing protein [Candidatus Wallbacteria bacterium]|nr:DUF192 domain-containing protein [Candidatus Wallbacteria bacterium]